MTDLTGRTILLTGASSGIGAATARVLGAAGATLIAHYAADKAGAEEATSAIPADRKLLLQADFREPGAGRDLWSQALAWRDHIDVLVNNAAIMPDNPIDAPDEDWDETWSAILRVNVVEPASLIRGAVRHYRDAGGGSHRAPPRSRAVRTAPRRRPARSRGLRRPRRTPAHRPGEEAAPTRFARPVRI